MNYPNLCWYFIDIKCYFLPHLRTATTLTWETEDTSTGVCCPPTRQPLRRSSWQRNLSSLRRRTWLSPHCWMSWFATLPVWLLFTTSPQMLLWRDVGRCVALCPETSRKFGLFFLFCFCYWLRSKHQRKTSAVATLRVVSCPFNIIEILLFDSRRQKCQFCCFGLTINIADLLQLKYELLHGWYNLLFNLIQAVFCISISTDDGVFMNPRRIIWGQWKSIKD